MVGLVFGVLTVMAAACGLVSGDDNAADVGGITQTLPSTTLALPTTSVLAAPTQTVPEQLGVEDPAGGIGNQTPPSPPTGATTGAGGASEPTWYVTTTSAAPSPEVGAVSTATSSSVILADPLDPPASVPLETTTTTAEAGSGPSRPVAGASLAEVQVLDTFPVEVKLKIVGSRPGPCHRLAIAGPNFLPDNRIDITITSAPGDNTCADDPQSFSRLVSLGQIDPGTYRVLVNDQPFVFTID